VGCVRRSSLPATVTVSRIARRSHHSPSPSNGRPDSCVKPAPIVELHARVGQHLSVCRHCGDRARTRARVANRHACRDAAGKRHRQSPDLRRGGLGTRRGEPADRRGDDQRRAGRDQDRRA
jgi:hypothetical protein